MNNIKGVPIRWDAASDKKLLGKLFSNIGNGAFANILTGINTADYNSPLLDYEWQTYWSNELAEKFFNNKKVTDSGDPIEVTDETGIYNSLTPVATSLLYADTNNNNKRDKWEEASMKIKVFVSDDGAKLLRAWHGVVPGDNELLIFLENNKGDTNSDAQLLAKAGSKAQAVIEKNAGNTNIYNWVNKQYTISREDLTDVLESAGNISFFMYMVQKVIKVAAKIISWTIEKVGELFYWIGEKIEKNFRIEDAVWQTQPPTDIKKWIDERQKVTKEIFKDFFSDWQQDDPGNISKQTVPTYESILNQVMNGLERFLTEFIESAPELIFAAICGVINGIIDMIAGIFTLIGMLLKLIAAAIKGTANFIADEHYYIALITEYADNITQALSKVDWDKVITEAYLGYFKFVYQTLPQLVSKAIDGVSKIQPVEIAYYIGYIGINIAVCFIPVVDLIQLAKIEKLAKPLQELFEIITKLVKKGGRFAATSAGSLFTLFEGFTEMLGKGTDEVIAFVKKIFDAVKGWLEDLLGYKILDDIASNDIDWLERKPTVGNLGGKIVTVKQIRRLRAILSKGGTELILEEKAIFKKYYRDIFYYMRMTNKVGGFSATTKEFYLIKDATEIIVFHEQCHFEHWKQVGNEIYQTLDLLEKESYVWEQIYKNKSLWTEAELTDALRYINEVRINFNLEPLEIKL